MAKTPEEVVDYLKKYNSEDFSIKKEDIKPGRYYFKVTSWNYSNMDYTISITTREHKVIILEINNPYMMINGETIPVDGNRGTAPIIYNNRKKKIVIPYDEIIEIKYPIGIIENIIFGLLVFGIVFLLGYLISIII